jgi:hypothetical protein
MSERPKDRSRPTDPAAEEPPDQQAGEEPPAPDEHRFAADEEVADDPAGAKQARTPGTGS